MYLVTFAVPIDEDKPATGDIDDDDDDVPGGYHCGHCKKKKKIESFYL